VTIRGRLSQTYTIGPGFLLANTERCDGCGSRVTRSSLEVWRLAGNREAWLCLDCAAETNRTGRFPERKEAR
jgi:hypothetical protein